MEEESFLNSVFGDYSVVSGGGDHPNRCTAEKLLFLPTCLLDIILADVSGGAAGEEEGATGMQPALFLNSVTRQPRSFGVTYSGAMLLADISGFTKLSDAYCKKGLDGLDSLHRVTNDYMNELCQCIQSHDGDIIKFAGDALICLFKEPSSTELGRPTHKLDSKARRMAALLGAYKAITCALQLKDKSIHNLTLHCAVSCGDFEIGCVGGHDGVWECIVTGSSMQSLSQCLDDAPSKAVCVTREVAALLKSAKAISLGVEEGLADGAAAAEEEVRQEEEQEEEQEQEPAATVVRRKKRRGPRSPEAPPPEAAADLAGVCPDEPAAAAAEPLLAEEPPPPYLELAVQRRRVRPSGNFLVTRLSLQRGPQHRPVVFYGGDRVVRMLPLLDEIDELVSGFVASPVAEATVGNTLHILSELREVTTLFMKIDDYSHETFPLARLNDFFTTYQLALARASGFNRQFLVDDKGCVAIGLWGVPGASHIDNARRAVWAAASLKLLLGERGTRVSIGVATGLVYCGTIGGSERKEYAAIGSKVNMAARLMGKACGEILVDGDTFVALPAEVQSLFVGVAPLQVKGAPEPVPAHRYSSAAVFSLSTATELVDLRAVVREPLLLHLRRLRGGDDGFIGSLAKTLTSISTAQASSSSIMSTLSSATEDAGSPSFLLLHGNAGSGVEEAVSWLREDCDASDMLCVCVRLEKEDKYRQYSGLTKLFREMVSPRDYDVLQRQCFIVHDLLRNVYPKITDLETKQRVAHPAMRIAFGVSTPFFAKYRSMSSAALEQWPQAPLPKLPHAAVHEVVIAVVKYMLSQTPTAVVIENLQFLDYLSFRMISGFSALRVRSFFLMTKTSLQLDDRTALRRVAGGSMGVSVGSVYSDYVKILAKNEHVTVVKLPFYTSAETARLLLSALRSAVQGGNVSSSAEQSSEARERAYVQLQCRAHMEDQQMRSCLNAALFDISGGNPFWVTIVLGYIKNKGPDIFLARIGASDSLPPRNFLALSPSSQQVAPVAEGQPPPPSLSPGKEQQQERGGKLSSFVLMSLGSLSSLEQSCLKLAAILGPSFSVTLLMSITPDQNKGQLVPTLEALCSAHWLRKQVEPPTSRHRRGAGSSDLPDEGSLSLQRSQQLGSLIVTAPQYFFTHRLIRETLYNALPATVKASIHYKVARFVDDHFLPGPDAEDALPEMAPSPAQADPASLGEMLSRESQMACYRIAGTHFSHSKTERTKAFRYLCHHAEYVAQEAYNPDELSRVVAIALGQCDSAYDCNCLLGIVSIAVQAFVNNQTKLVLAAEEITIPAANPTGGDGGFVRALYLRLFPPLSFDKNENITELRKLLRLDSSISRHFDSSLRHSIANMTPLPSEEERLRVQSESWRERLVSRRLLDRDTQATRVRRDEGKSFFSSFRKSGHSSSDNRRLDPFLELLAVQRSEATVMARVDRAIESGGRAKGKPSYKVKAAMAKKSSSFCVVV